MSSVPCRTSLRCFDSFGMEETLPSITPMVVIRLSNRQDVARNDEIRAMHSLKTSLTISPVKRAWSPRSRLIRTNHATDLGSSGILEKAKWQKTMTSKASCNIMGFQRDCSTGHAHH